MDHAPRATLLRQVPLAWAVRHRGGSVRRHDIDVESAALYNLVRRSPSVTADLRITDGGHDWDVWTPAFVDGMRLLGPGLVS